MPIIQIMRGSGNTVYSRDEAMRYLGPFERQQLVPPPKKKKELPPSLHILIISFENLARTELTQSRIVLWDLNDELWPPGW